MSSFLDSPLASANCNFMQKFPKIDQNDKIVKKSWAYKILVKKPYSTEVPYYTEAYWREVWLYIEFWVMNPANPGLLLCSAK